MKRKMVSAVTLTILLTSILILAFNIQPVKASGTIYIRADGSVEPDTAPISTLDNVTYTFTDNIYDSIVVERSNITIDGNGCAVQGTGSGNGLYLYHIHNVTIKNMEIKAFENGIRLDWSSNNTIAGNNITANNWIGVSLGHSDSNTIKRNNITNSGDKGIMLGSSNNNLLVDNIASKTTYGIELSASNNNVLVGNTASNNRWSGISLWNSNSNVIYHNNFIDNLGWQAYIPIYPKSYNNTWDDGYPSGGNYWSDYIGVDVKSGSNQDLPGSDGIGDIPYIIDANNRDRYPLMHSWSPLPVHNINTGLGYATIQESINANETSDGHTIFVEAGTYHENIVVNKTVSLIGENKDTTIIDSRRTGGTSVNVTSSKATLSGFTIQYSGAWYSDSGLLLYHSNESLITGNIITNNFNGILLTASCGNNIIDNVIINNYYFGICLSNSNYNNFSGNIISSNAHGVYFGVSGGNVLRENQMSDNAYNFGVTGVYLPDFIQDVDVSNTIEGKPLYYLMNRHDEQIPADAGYVAAVNSTNIVVRDLTLANNDNGVLFVNTNSSIIENVTVTSNYGGIELRNSNDNTICNSIASNNQWGILIEMSNRNSISRNFISGNNQMGIGLGSESASNIINENTISNNFGAGISIWESEENTIYHNNFLNDHVYITTGYTNTWDNGYPSGGNYWSDYVGVDVKSGPNQDLPGSDCIGDTPYIIDANNTDHYPLMNPYGAPPPPTYTLTITTTAGGTTNPAPGTYSYTANSTVQVTAIPNPNYLFHHWELESINVGSANPYTVLMSTNHILRAVFSPIPPPKPVGGYSILTQTPTTEKPLSLYLAIMAILTAAFTTVRHKTHKRRK